MLAVQIFYSYRAACFGKNKHCGRGRHLKHSQGRVWFLRVKLPPWEGRGQGEGGEAWLDRRDKGVKLRERSLCRELLGLVAPIRQPGNWVSELELKL